MYLGIEIGGTKLQVGVGDGKSTDLSTVMRMDVKRANGAAGVLKQISDSTKKFVSEFSRGDHPIRGIGIGFGGPVDNSTGKVITSHQVEGWDGFELSAWGRAEFGLPTTIGNDCDAAALAEAKFGAGKGQRIVLYVTVGTGVGGGLVVDEELFAAHKLARAEIGHLRPGLEATSNADTVEAIVSGPGIENALRRQLSTMDRDVAEELFLAVSNESSTEGFVEPISTLLSYFSARDIATAAKQGNRTALAIYEHATKTLGWAIAQAITLTAADIVVIGGGVSLAGEDLFFEPVRRSVAQYVFRPLVGGYQIVPASLGEEVVVHGAIALAVQA